LIHSDEWDLALVQIDSALKLDPEDPTLNTAKALVLTRLGKYKVAADLYERVLATVGGRARKFRLATRDQAAECYRRWAEQDLRLDDYEARHEHLGRALAIIEEAFVENDYDSQVIRRLTRVVDALMDCAIKDEDEAAASGVIEALRRSDKMIGSDLLELYNLRRFKAAFGSLHAQLDGLAIKEMRFDLEDEDKSQEELSSAAESTTKPGVIQRLEPGANFGAIRDEDGNEWFFHRGELEPGQKWRDFRQGRRVSFQTRRDPRGLFAVNVIALD